MAASAALQRFFILASIARSLADIRCGNSAGPRCRNWFNEMFCDSTDGACCHDAFNGWCCPRGFRCAGTFSDPGGNTHCMTPSRVSSSCICGDTHYEIIGMTPVGEPTVNAAWDDHLTACCQWPTEDCGWTTTISRTDSQTVSWSDAVTVGYSMTWNVEAGPALELGQIGFNVQDTFTYGQETTTTDSQSYTNGCVCTADRCNGPFTNLRFRLQVVHSTQPVEITVRKCGATQRISGTVMTKQWEGHSQCDVETNLTSCPALMGEATPEVDGVHSTVHLCGAVWLLSLLCCFLASK